MRILFALLCVLALLQACAPTPEKRLPEPPPVDSELLAKARSLAEMGDYAASADLYQELALTTTAPLRQDLLFDAARTLLLARDAAAAAALLAAINVAELPPTYELRRRLLLAEADLAMNLSAEALERLREGLPPDTPIALRQRYHQIRASALERAGHPLQGARELVKLDPWLKESESRLDNQVEILERLTLLPAATLELDRPTPPDELTGWMALASILKDPSQELLLVEPQIESWREQFPGHPALPELPEAYIARMQSLYYRPARITLLLPESGRYQRVAAALREGFLAAYYAQPAGSRPELRFLDSSDSANAWPLYQTAVAEGAEMVVGPLDKDAVAQLVRAGELDVPVLALNQVPPDIGFPLNLYQFSLSPEDEARQVAERAWLDGHTRALVMTPEGDWGERVRESFETHWVTLGGLVVGSQTYDPRENDFTVPLQQMLKLDQSIQRRRELQRLFGKNLEFEPRRRQDAQFLFLAARAQKAREIRPQLQFHHASDLPVYTTSHAYSGFGSPSRDRDLEGILFPDIPWMAPGDQAATLVRRELDSVLPGDARYARFRAMGIDSYNLIAYLPRLRRFPDESLDGHTGELYLDELNQVHRRLVWLQIRDGVPELFGEEQTPSEETGPSPGGLPAPSGSPTSLPPPNAEAPQSGDSPVP